MKVIGIAGRHRHGAAALAVDGAIVAAASEETYVRVPGVGYGQTGGFPSRAVEACLTRAGLTIAEVDRLAVGTEPAVDPVTEEGAVLAHFPRRWPTGISTPPVCPFHAPYAGGLV